MLNASSTVPTTLDAPLGHINVHIRDGAAILLHGKPAYTTTETREGPYALLVTLDKGGHASGSAYVDDGESVPPTPSSTITFKASGGSLSISRVGVFRVAQKLETVTVLGVEKKPVGVSVNGKRVPQNEWKFEEGLGRLVVEGLGLDLNGVAKLTW